MGTLSLASSGGGTISLAPASSASSATITFPATTGNAILDANFTGTNQLLSGNGYQKLPGGLIIQWGSTTYPGSGISTGTYPIAFPNAVLSLATGCNAGTGYSGGYFANVGGINNSTFSYAVFLNTSTTSATAIAISFIAIGY